MNRRITLVRPSQMWDSFMDEFFNPASMNTVFQGTVDIDLYETDTDVMVEFKAPGFNKDDIKITLEDNILSVEGTLKEEKEKKEGRKYHMKEIREESFSRTVSLPTKVQIEKAEAKFEKGVMTIKLPKAEEVKPKSITIKAE
jgi:HSP20 family protein